MIKNLKRTIYLMTFLKYNRFNLVLKSCVKKTGHCYGCTSGYPQEDFYY